MLTEQDKKFATVVVKLGIAKVKQVEDTIKVQDKLVDLGIEKDLPAVMLDKKYITEKDIKKTYRAMEYERIIQEDRVVIDLLVSSNLISDELVVSFKKKQKKIVQEEDREIPTMEKLIEDSGKFSEKEIEAIREKINVLKSKIQEQKKDVLCPRCKINVIPVNYRCPRCGDIIQFEFQELDVDDKKKANMWWLRYRNPQERNDVVTEIEYKKIENWILNGSLTKEAFVKKTPQEPFVNICEYEIFNSLFKKYEEKLQEEERIRRQERLKKRLKFVGIPAIIICAIVIFIIIASGKDTKSVELNTQASKSDKKLIRYKDMLLPPNELIERMEKRYGPASNFDYEDGYVSGVVVNKDESNVKVYVFKGDSSVQYQELSIPIEVYKKSLFRNEYNKRTQDLMEQTSKQLLSNEAKMEQHFDLAMWCKEHSLYEEMRKELVECYKINPNNEQVRHALQFLLPEEQTAEPGKTRSLIFFPEKLNFFSIAWKDISYRPELKEREGADYDFSIEKTDIAPILSERLLKELPDEDSGKFMQGYIRYLGKWYSREYLTRWLNLNKDPLVYLSSRFSIYSNLHEINGELRGFFNENLEKLIEYAENHFMKITDSSKKLSESYKWNVLLGPDSDALNALSYYITETDQKSVKFLNIIFQDPSEIQLLKYPLLKEISNTLFNMYFSKDIPWLRIGMAEKIALSYPDEEYQSHLFLDDAFAKIILESIFIKKSFVDTYNNLYVTASDIRSTPYNWFLLSFLYDKCPESLRSYLSDSHHSQERPFKDRFHRILDEQRYWKRYALERTEKILMHTCSLGSVTPAHILLFSHSYAMLFCEGSSDEQAEFFMRRFSKSWSGIIQKSMSILEALRYLALIKEECASYKEASDIYSKLLNLYTQAGSGTQFDQVKQALVINCNRLKSKSSK